MAMDANLILRGPVSGVYTDLEDGDTSATTIAINADGNYVVDLGPHGTGAKGIDIVVIFHDTAGDYLDTLDCQICDSDHIAGGWELNLEFPRIYTHTREIKVICTTAFTAANDFLVDLTEGGAAYDGHIIAFSRELLVVGGVGKIWVAMQDLNDTYPTNADTLTSAGTSFPAICGNAVAALALNKISRPDVPSPRLTSRRDCASVEFCKYNVSNTPSPPSGSASGLNITLIPRHAATASSNIA